MNSQVKTILLTVLALSALTIAIVELSGVSSRALYNKYGIGTPSPHGSELAERNERDDMVKKMPKTN